MAPADDRPIVSLAEARARGLKQYFTGKPCKYGHIAPRSTAYRECAKCSEGAFKRDNNARSRARELGLAKYFTGKPCKSGHVAERYTSDGKCVACGCQDERKRNINGKSNQALRLWRRLNPDAAKAQVHKRRARRLGALGHYTSADIKRIRKLQHNCCARCGKSLKNLKAHIDHIVPLAKDGTNWPRNLQLLCAGCNSSKGSRDPLEDAKRLGRLL